MKRLSDYKGEEAIELWADLLEPLTEIFGDKVVQASLLGGGSVLSKAKNILSTHKKAAADILLRIDPEPLNGLNIIARLVSLINEFQESGYFGDFFESASQETTESEFSGDVTENTTAGEN